MPHLCFCPSSRTEQRNTARCGGRGPERLNNTRQALLFLLLKSSRLSTSSCPQPDFNWVYTAAHTLSLPFPLFLPIFLTCTSFPIWVFVFTPFPFEHLLQACTLQGLCLLLPFLFGFTFLYLLLPSTLCLYLLHTYTRVYLKTVLFRVYVCV